jgi:hypothetical protein
VISQVPHRYLSHAPTVSRVRHGASSTVPWYPRPSPRAIGHVARLMGGPAGRDILECVTDTAAPTLAPPAVRPLRLGSYEVLGVVSWPVSGDGLRAACGPTLPSDRRRTQ